MHDEYKYVEVEQEVRHDLVDGYLPLSLTPEEVARVTALMTWVACEAYRRGYDRLAPPDF
jgi:hypothetical protein